MRRRIFLLTALLSGACTEQNPAFMPNVSADAGPGPATVALDGGLAATDAAPRDAAAGDLGGSGDRPASAAEVGRGEVASDAPPPDVARDTGPPPVSADNARHPFELDNHGWRDLRGGAGTLRRTTTRAYRGNSALEVGLDLAAGGERFVGLDMALGAVMPGAGTTLTFRVWVPAGNKLVYVQAFVIYFPRGQASSTWAGKLVLAPQLTSDAWNSVAVTVPADSDQVIELGMQFKSDTGWRGTAYLDSVNW